jgi:hypothetical protein
MVNTIHLSMFGIMAQHSLNSEFAARDGETHRCQCFEYKALKTETERAEFFQAHGVRWTELARLLYFDLVQFTVIDPMHNLLLSEFWATL